MVDIVHRVGVTSTPDKVYRAITTIDGLSAWWTYASETADGLLELRSGNGDSGGCDVKIVESRPDTRVLWRVVGGPAEWIGTSVSFDLVEDGEWTIVLFTHAGWREPIEFMNHCSTKWAVFLLSLKSLVEKGTGTAHPHSVQIGNWN
jgi:Activator of Hsp90 ATPase homolog 1-like protein